MTIVISPHDPLLLVITFSNLTPTLSMRSMCLYKQLESFAKNHLTSFDQFNQTILSVYISNWYMFLNHSQKVLVLSQSNRPRSPELCFGWQDPMVGMTLILGTTPSTHQHQHRRSDIETQLWNMETPRHWSGCDATSAACVFFRVRGAAQWFFGAFLFTSDADDVIRVFSRYYIDGCIHTWARFQIYWLFIYIYI